MSGPSSPAKPINTGVTGLTTFRGNASRDFYGMGPVPRDPVVRWQTPDRPMCMTSYTGPDPKRWCGTGWTGQPNVLLRDDGRIEVREGAYDGAYHFLDGSTGQPLRPRFRRSTSPRARRRRTRTAIRCTTRAAATTTSGSSPSTDRPR